jgi:hypothetical protein
LFFYCSFDRTFCKTHTNSVSFSTIVWKNMFDEPKKHVLAKNMCLIKKVVTLICSRNKNDISEK